MNTNYQKKELILEVEHNQTKEGVFHITRHHKTL